VTVAHNGLAALEFLMLSDYEAVLLDLVLPDLDGFSILEHLRVRRPELLRRVIVITGVPERYASSIDRSPICAVLEKPVDVQQLSAALQRCIESKVADFEPGGESAEDTLSSRKEKKPIRQR
jgi:DNA-binding NtrC family response regulator